MLTDYLTSSESVVVFLQVGHQTDTKWVARVEALLLDKEVHALCETLVVSHSERFNAVWLGQASFYLLGHLTPFWLVTWVILEMLHVLDSHLYYFCFLDPAPPLLEVRWGYEAAEICQAVVHPVPPPLLYDSVRERVLQHRSSRNISHSTLYWVINSRTFLRGYGRYWFKRIKACQHSKNCPRRFLSPEYVLWRNECIWIDVNIEYVCNAS